MTVGNFGEGGNSSPSVIHADTAHPDQIFIPDAQFLFTAHFHRAGPDLILTGSDGHKVIVPGYFASEHHAALVAPNGASLSSHLVDLLAGSAAPNEYAQAGPITPPEPIGRVEKIVGEVTVIRNGVSVTLNVGDAVYKSDVVQTAANSSAGVAFPDGSALNLVANTRMALNEYSYDPNSNSNSALFNLVEGGLSFVAGKVAHTGDMKIGTPIATMGIRGTAGWLYEEQVANITANAGNVTLHFAAVFDGVTNTQSLYSLYAVDANGNLLRDANGDLIELAQVSSLQGNLVTTLTGNGFGSLPSVGVAPPDAAQMNFFNFVAPQVIEMAKLAIQQYLLQQQPNQANPQSNPGTSGSPGSELPPHTELIQPITNPITGQTIGTLTATIASGSGDSGGNPFNTSPQQQQATQNQTQAPTVPTWTGGATGSFNSAPNWSGPQPGPQNSPIVDAPNSHPTVTQDETIQGLTVGAGDSVSVVGDPTLTITNGGQVVVEASGSAVGEIEATGVGAYVIATAETVSNQGEILADTSGVVELQSDTITNSGTIAATTSGSTVLSNDTITNPGTIDADAGGHVSISKSTVFNAGGTIEVSPTGPDAILTLGDDTAVFGGVLTIGSGGELSITSDEGAAHGAQLLGVAVTDNGGHIDVGSATSRATLTLMNDAAVTGGALTVHAGSTLAIATDEGPGHGAVLDAVSVDNFGTVSASGGAVGTFEPGSFTNDAGGKVIATGAGSAISIDGMTNFGTVEATSGGIITLMGNLINELGAVVEADDGGSLDLAGVISNKGEVSVAIGAALDLSGAIINGGTIIDNGNIKVSASSTIDGGALVQGHAGQLTIDAGTTLTLDDATLENVDAVNHGTLQVDSDQTLMISGTTVDNGTIVDNGLVEISGAVAINDLVKGQGGAGPISVDYGATLTLDGATLENVDVANDGTLRIDAGAALTLANSTISGGAIVVDGSVIVNQNSTIDNHAVVQGDAGQLTVSGATLTLDDASLDTINVSNGGTLQIDSGHTLTLTNTTISGGALNDGGALNVDHSTITGAAITLGARGPSLTVLPDVSGIDSGIDFAAINNAGQVLVLAYSDATLYYGSTAYVEIKDPNDVPYYLSFSGYNSGVFAINDSGEVIGFYSDFGVARGFVYSNGSYSTLDDPSAGYLESTIPQGINNAGEIAGFYYDNNGLAHGFIYSGGSYTTLDDPAAAYGTFIRGINDAGVAFGTYYSADHGEHNFVYANGSFITLNDPLAAPQDTFITGINNAGQVVGFYYDANTRAHGFIYSDGVFTTLTDPSNVYGTVAQGINDEGEVVGFWLDAAGNEHGFIYSNGSFTNSAAFPVDFQSINDDGQVAAVNGANAYVYTSATTVLGDGTAVNGGTLSIANLDLVKIESGSDGSGATLNHVGVTSQGIIEVGSTATSDATLALIDDTSVTGGSLMVHAGSTLAIGTDEGAGHGATLDAVSVENFGTVSASGGAVGTFEAGSFTNESGGHVIATGAGSQISIDAANNFGTVEAVSGGVVSLTGDLVNESGATVLSRDGGIVHITPTGGENDGTITADNASVVLNLSDAARHADDHGNVGTMQAVDSGTFTITDATSQATGEGQTFNNPGTLAAESGGTVLVKVATDNSGDGVSEGGHIVASGAGSFVDFFLSVAGGDATISDGGKVEYGWSSDVATTFDGAGTLVVDHQNQSGADFALSPYSIGGTTFDTASYTGTISGFGQGDTVDLTDVTYTAGEYAVWDQTSTQNGGTGILEIFSAGGALEASLNLNGIYASGEFALASDASQANGATGTDVNFNSVSFNSGIAQGYQYDGPNADGTFYYFGTGYPGPQISADGSALTLTDGGEGEAASWFDNNKVSIADFSASFDYQATGEPAGMGDGFAFILQNDPSGASALESEGSFPSYGGSGLGYAGISNSLAIEFNLYSGNGAGTSFQAAGATGDYVSTGSVDFADGDKIQVVIAYNGSVLTETLTDLDNGTTFSASETISLAQLEAILGNHDTASVGFSAASGGATAAQTVSDFTFQSGPLFSINNSAIADVGTVAHAAIAADAPVVIENGTTLHLTEPSSEIVSFAGSFGDVIVDNPSAFTGTISGISGSGDWLDLGGFASHHGDVFAISSAYNGTDTILTVADTTNHSGPESISLAGDYTGDVFTAAYDGNGGADVVGSPAADSTTVVSTATGDSVSGVIAFSNVGSSDTASIAADGPHYIGSSAIAGIGNGEINFSIDISSDQINLPPGQTLTQSYDVMFKNTDPAANQSQTVSVTIGGPGDDHFVFAPGIGADTVVNFNPQQDTIELDHFAAAQTVQELQSLITTDVHGDAVIDLGHNDSITLANTTAAQLQQAIQNGHVLLH